MCRCADVQMGRKADLRMGGYVDMWICRCEEVQIGRMVDVRMGGYVDV